MQITVAELSKLLGGEFVGDGNVLLNKAAKIEEGEPGALSFLANPRYESYLYETKSSAVLVNRDFNPSAPVTTTLIRVDNAYSGFTLFLEKFGNALSHKSGVEGNAFVHEKARTGKDVYVGSNSYLAEDVQVDDGTKIFPQVFLGDRVKIGKNCCVYAGVYIYADTEIGDNVIIHSGTVIGSDGFGFAPQADRSYKKIPQTGNVIIESDVEIGANCSIDRATIGSTIIRKGVKLDNLVQVAHNVEIGDHTVIAAQSGIAGSTKIGKHCVIAGQVGIVGHITIADGSQIGAQSGINNSLKETEQKWFGTPAFEYKDALKAAIVYKKLPEMHRKLRELEQRLEELSSEHHASRKK
jgi:UDP-3-O-[3-hydroxymyristoyl] glucosamine N-acyltransferase